LPSPPIGCIIVSTDCHPEYIQEGEILMSKELTNEQKAHDLAVAYATYMAASRECGSDVEPFYQDYENNYALFLNLVKQNA
jgi:hypothetical protein